MGSDGSKSAGKSNPTTLALVPGGHGVIHGHLTCYSYGPSGNGNGFGDSTENQPRVWEIDRVATDWGRAEVTHIRAEGNRFGIGKPGLRHSVES